ncbi:MAG: DUF4271 domain-containing protein [Bacteroidetes bacterium]|nr:DUF4271 domain-containing protein [Bacteroidota bacterium]
MRFPRKLFVFIITFCLLLLHVCGYSKVQPAKYGVSALDTAALHKQALVYIDSFYHALPQLNSKRIIMNIERSHSMVDKTNDFYLLLFLCIMLGLIRFSDRRYFQNLWRAFWSATLSTRQLKDQLLGAPLSNLLMNVFFTISGGAYVYYVTMILSPQRTAMLPASLLILLMVGGVMAIYLGKYFMIRFSGWALRLEGVTNQYIFNVFLINKIIGVILLPFIMLLAFGNPIMAQPVIIVSFIVVGILLINRYTRSWQVFGSFFQYSKFHFFTYLCASELLPLALLMKFMVRALWH